ncbi:MAG: hypothetical protein O7F08_13970 [Deltaproteobacteria bacterium]|nr:hypothetical protein [Deltaproteobacteria bacterium]
MRRSGSATSINGDWPGRLTRLPVTGLFFQERAPKVQRPAYFEF